jgi:threonine/homoserine/homoserine lactone efflux protein
MSYRLWSLFVVTEIILCLTPGPAVLLVVSQAMRHGFGKAMRSLLGILAANTFYFVLAATSLGAMLVASHRLFFAIKWLGAAYLVVLGIQALRAPAPQVATDATPPRAFLHGLALQLSNPKMLLFFTAILPQFIVPNAPIMLQMLILSLTSLAVEAVVLTSYALLAGRAASAGHSRFARVTHRLSGGLLIAAGLGLAALEPR